MESDERIREAVTNTEIIRHPKQGLYTFGTTNIYYYMVTEPAYSELVKDVNETVIREGRVVAERPRIVTPFYLSRLQGFSLEAKKYLSSIIETLGANAPGLFYTYKNEPKGLSVVSDDVRSVMEKLGAEIDKRGDSLAAIIKGQDELWDVSLLKFIYDLTRRSIEDNLRQMGNRGLLDIDSRGVPADARMRIEDLFRQVSNGEREPGELKSELDRWGLFGEYEDRFFSLFKKGSRRNE